MNTLLEVVKDLTRFVFVEFFGWRDIHAEERHGKKTFAVALHSPLVTPERKSAPLLPEKATKESDTLTVSVVAEQAHLFLEPVASFDSVIASVPYGTALTVYQAMNRWYRTVYRGHSGWVLKDAVTSDNIYPQFRLGQYYDAKNIETIKLRSFIHDEFNGGLIEAPLEDAEYVTYRLRQKAKVLPWGEVRPRVSGSWKQLLRGAPGVHIGILPRAESVMETVDDNGSGLLSYVESVFPDDSIIVSEIGFPEEGRYSERTLPKEEWREFRPVFIAVA